MTPLRIVLCTAPVKDAKGIARKLVEEKLVACVNLTQVQSVYRWQGNVVEDDELLLIMKTQESRVDALMKRIPEIHPYTVPEIVVLTTENVLEKYLAWAVAESTPS